MVSVAIVLVLILGTINVINIVKASRDSDQLIELIAAGKGDIRPDMFNDRSDREPPMGEMEDDRFRPDDLPEEPKDFIRGAFNKETPYETRYFTVTVDAEGNITEQSLKSIASVDEESAAELAESVIASGRTSGYKSDFKYKVVDTDDGGKMIIFLDRTRSIETIRTFLLASVGVSAAGLAMVFVLVFFISKKAMKPIAESYEKQKVFITDASHELKTPLTIIDANTEVIELESGENEWTVAIHNQVKRLTSLTENLVMLSRMEEETPRSGYTDFSLSDAITESVEPFFVSAENRGKRFAVEVKNNVTLNGDERSIRKMIGLLCDNAIKYSSNDATIKVSLTGGDHPTLKFSNPADGLEKGSYDVLFERFYRADKSRSSETGGYGIGLSVVKAIAEAHKAKATAASPDGRDIVFTIVF